MTKTDHTSTFAIDANGNVVGKLQGGAIDSARIVSWNRGFTFAAADSVMTVGPSGRTMLANNEAAVEGIAHDYASGRSLVWFNTGPGGGTASQYRHDYVLTFPDTAPLPGSVPGIMLSAAHCGERAFGVVAAFDDLTSDQPMIKHRLFELPLAGGEPVLRGEWEWPNMFRSESRTAACSADGSALFNLYGSVDARRDRAGALGLELVRLDTGTGARTQSHVDMAGHSAWSRPNTLTRIGDRLYWINGDDGAVLSLPLDQPSEVRKEWDLGAKGFGHQATVTGTTVAHIDFHHTPSYAEYDLITGRRIRGPIELPWLKPIIGAQAESGKTTYAVAGVACLPAPSPRP
ncbi:hypothetical protein NDR87_09015 [Nocardia sp. CDC159]|uniref:Uncharacterized protein n=1 Tax=Nocardia pulmonis TaxID=2951408 RepID=A0A9X2E3N1_9NOCA|nr:MULTISPECIES: hypothetical protein [Nocardia]MCM6773609.1 hypothetical protein [Nocardia pulmonis]MCM6786496.1 hypothetical protein [Nocardia sp. CDC159]